jgi:pimeloyl-ACP methyl ester carboxylesterase
MFVEISGRLINTASFGAGPRTFLTFGTWVFGWEAWQCQLELLSRSWRTVAFDHRGCGETVAEPDEISLEALVSDIFGVMDALNVQRCVLAVESSSTIIALHAVLQHPERFDGLILVAGVPSVPASSDDLAPRTEAELRETIEMFIAACVPAPGHGHLRRWLHTISSRCSPLQAAHLSHCVAGQDLTPRLADVGVPTLLIHGAADAIVPVSSAQLMAASIPHSRLLILEDSDHVPIMTRPVEVATAIDAFMHEL